MLNSLKLTNFQQHRALEVNFTSGLNVLRGANEAGKSATFSAIAYAYYGARALPLSLEDTVTWGESVNTLKVEHSFTHNGNDYIITRKKSGAELLGPDSLRVSGHSEVTSYMEALFNCNMATAVATMIAGQGQLKESLDGSAVSLIERLSNMGLIDELVDRVQTRLPSGNTKIFESQLEALPIVDVPVGDFGALESVVTAAKQVEFAAFDAADAANVAYERAKVEAERATLRINSAKEITIRRKMLSNQLTAAQESAVVQAPVTDETSTMEALTAALVKQNSQVVVATKWKMFAELPIVESYLDRPAVEADVLSIESSITACMADVRNAELARATALAKVITQSACGLCGKDLTDVPEVAAVNAAAQAEALALSEKIADFKAQRVILDRDYGHLKTLYAADHALALKIAQLVTYVDVDNAYIPSKVTWKGPTAVQELDTNDYVKRIDALRKHQAKVALHDSLTTTALVTAEHLKQTIAELPTLEADPADALAAPAAAAALVEARAATVRLHTAKATTAAAIAALASAVQAHNYALERHAAGLAKRAELIATLAEYGDNNRLIKKLRDARPVVAKKLWGTVLAAVSTYFSMVRGTPSVVTRDDSTFLVDGKSVKAYSGSTKDALGLAIRMTLQKTFLGSLNTMLVDEPAAAADDVRETAMLGMLASCGYEQVVLVTHSDLADSFAANIIRI
jgi:DNA repair exonuclease SbcCD ATPase subunit